MGIIGKAAARPCGGPFGLVTDNKALTWLGDPGKWWPTKGTS